MDLQNYNLKELSEAGADCELVDPITQEPFQDPAFITVMGTDSDMYREAIRRKAQRSFNSKKRQTIDVDKTDREAIELLAALTLGWQGIAEGGEEIKFSRDAAIELYSKYAWIREQVDEFVADRANFTKS